MRYGSIISLIQSNYKVKSRVSGKISKVSEVKGVQDAHGIQQTS